MTIHGELVSVDLSNPTVGIYYGIQDGGFSASDWNNSFVEVNGGQEVDSEILMRQLLDLLQVKIPFQAFRQTMALFGRGTPAVRNR